jgi:iron complex outermembrane recepter protein
MKLPHLAPARAPSSNRRATAPRWLPPLTALALATTGWASAQTAPDATIVITGNPFERPLGATAASVLAGAELQRRRGASLGDTLDGLPGVAATGYGPNASRPVVRGLDGDRVRLLDNGGSSVDASNLSFDHAVALDPLVAERVEVLRGPAALLYGGSAIGGVVNVIDNRIPRRAATGLGGRAEVRLGGAARERAAAAVLDGGAGSLAWHADGFQRRTDDLRVPTFEPVADGAALPRSDRVRNSAAEARGGALGASWVGAQGQVGAAVDTLRHDYGVTVEPDVGIRLQRDRVSAAGEWRVPAAALQSLSLRAGHTRYQHQEVEGDGAVGTTFRSRGQDLRAEVRHRFMPGAEGLWGVQAETLSFSALGEEAFVPGTRTRSAALFALQAWPVGPGTFTVGVRAERVRVSSDGDVDAAAAPRFGAPQARSYAPRSGSLALALPLGAAAGGWQLLLSMGHVERAPAYYELYANGVHLATDAFEVGDPMLGLERSRHGEAALAWTRGAHRVKLALHATRFARYIALDATGTDIDVAEPGDPPEFVPEYRFQAVRARLVGVEAEARVRLHDGAWKLDLEGQIDHTRGDNLSAGEPLPRLAPLRARLGLVGAQGPWTLGMTLAHDARQARVSRNDSPTAAFTRWDLWARFDTAAGLAVWAKLNNATDELGYASTAVATIRGLSPLPGRALAAGVTLRW